MRGILLLSSGIDSPVAGHIILKNGAELLAVHFNNSPDKNSKSVEVAGELVKRLSQLHNKGIALYVVENYENERMISERCDRRYQCVLCKRMMYRIAEVIGRKEGCDFMISGENLGQVASQTLDNLAVLDRAVEMKVIRPLICNEKKDTVRIAERIGTFEISKQGNIRCPFVPNKPLTKAVSERVAEEEKGLDIKTMVSESVGSCRRVSLGRGLE